MFTLSNINTKPYTLTPICKNRFDINFENDILNTHCCKIKDKHIWFYLNVINGEIVPVNLIKKIISDQKILNIEISILNPTGEIISYICVEGVTLLKIKKLIDFDYNVKSGIVKIKVKYKYKDQKTFSGIKEIINYRRKKKIEKINQL